MHRNVGSKKALDRRYNELYHKQHRHLVSHGLYPGFKVKEKQAMGEIWTIADANNVYAFFHINQTDELETNKALLIYDLIFNQDYDVNVLAEVLMCFLRQNFYGQNIYIRIEDYFKGGKQLISAMQHKHVYTSVSMLKKDLSDINKKYLRSDVKIRQFTVNKDEELFSALYYEIFKDISPVFSKEKIMKWVEAWVNLSTFDPDLYLFAECEQKPVGLVAIEINVESAGTGHLYEIGVVKAFRGCGIAPLLFHNCVGKSIEKGAKRLLLRVRVSNIIAHRFFLNYGFKDLYKRDYFCLL